MKINVDLTKQQNFIFDELVKIIKKIGDSEENEDNYVDVITYFVQLKSLLREANKNAFIVSSLKPNHEITYFDQDEKLFHKVPIGEIDFRYGTEEEQLDENEVQRISNYLRKTEFKADIPQIEINLGVFDERLDEEARARANQESKPNGSLIYKVEKGSNVLGEWI